MMFLRSFLISGIAVTALIFAVVAHAAENPTGAPPQAPSPTTPSTTKKEPRKQTITFEDELVEGTTQKPDLFYLFQKKNFNFKRMMKLRNDFIPEMKRSTEDVQRGKGNN